VVVNHQLKSPPIFIIHCLDIRQNIKPIFTCYKATERNPSFIPAFT